MNYVIWNISLNKNTFNFGGAEWVVDGEIGRMVYPASWDKDVVRTYYSHGWGHSHKEEVA